MAHSFYYWSVPTMRKFLDLLSWNLDPLKLVLSSGWCYSTSSPHGLTHPPLNKCRLVNVPLECKCNTARLARWSESRDHNLSSAGHSVHTASGGTGFQATAWRGWLIMNIDPTYTTVFSWEPRLTAVGVSCYQHPASHHAFVCSASVSTHYNATSMEAGALSCSESPAPSKSRPIADIQ